MKSIITQEFKQELAEAIEQLLMKHGLDAKVQNASYSTNTETPKKRGRPKKVVDVVPSENSSIPKKRGRPKGSKKSATPLTDKQARLGTIKEVWAKLKDVDPATIKTT